MTTIRFDKPTNADVRFIADNLRQSDILEFRCIFPEGDLILPLEVSVGLSDECYVAYQNEVPIALFGVAKDGINSHGIPWMAGTDAMNQCPIRTLRAVRRSVDFWLARYGHLKNYVHQDNLKSQAMLKWLGFTVETTPEEGMRPDFFPFWRKTWQ